MFCWMQLIYGINLYYENKQNCMKKFFFIQKFSEGGFFVRDWFNLLVVWLCSYYISSLMVVGLKVLLIYLFI